MEEKKNIRTHAKARVATRLSHSLLLALTLLCAGCEEDELMNTPSTQPNISFSTSIFEEDDWKEVEKTRASYDDAALTKTLFVSGDKIGVYAHLNDPGDFMSNQEVTYDGTTWSYSPTKYWPVDNQQITFCAYYPRETSINSGRLPEWEYNGKNDLLTSVVKANKTAGAVNFTGENAMKHAFQKLRLRFVSPHIVSTQIEKIVFNEMPSTIVLTPISDIGVSGGVSTGTLTIDKGFIGEDFEITTDMNDITRYYITTLADKTSFSGTIYFKHDNNTTTQKLFSFTTEGGKGKTYLITFNIGDENMTETVVTYEEANCYLINTLNVTGNQQRYRIPINRVFDYWNMYGGAALNENIKWKVEVIWQDKNQQLIEFVNDNKGVTAESGGAYATGAGNDKYISVRPISSTSKGNVLIGVRENKKSWTYENDGYLWSFHLWITDYNPTYSMPWQDEKYFYEVVSGYVHRYPDSAEEDANVWSSSGIYNGKYMMDRNMGMLSVESTARSWADMDVLHYALGRKDPFPAVGKSLYKMGENCEISPYSLPAVKTYSESETTRDYCVKHPATFISSDGWWCNDDEPNSMGVLWGDEKITQGSLGDVYKEKSFFDPCPPGWKVPPHTDTYKCFGDNIIAIQTPTTDSQHYGWKFTFGDDQSSYVYFPFHGFRTKSGAMNSSTPSTTTYTLGMIPLNAKFLVGNNVGDDVPNTTDINADMFSKKIGYCTYDGVRCQTVSLRAIQE